MWLNLSHGQLVIENKFTHTSWSCYAHRPVMWSAGSIKHVRSHLLSLYLCIFPIWCPQQATLMREYHWLIELHVLSCTRVTYHKRVNAWPTVRLDVLSRMLRTQIELINYKLINNQHYNDNH